MTGFLFQSFNHVLFIFTHMKLIVLLFYICSFLFLESCSHTCPPPADDPLVAASLFLDNCLKGEFETASCYMLQDTANKRLLIDEEKIYKSKSTKEQNEYATASIHIDNDEVLDEKTHIIFYKNSYDKIARKIKLLQQNNGWLADFSYTYNGD